MRVAAAGLALVMCGAQAPAPVAPPAADAVVAQSGSNTLTMSGLRAMIEAVDPATREQLQHDPAALARAVRAQMLQRVLLEEARAKKWDLRPDVAFRADQAREAAIVSSYVASATEPPPDYPSEAEIQAAYEANKPQLVVPRQYHLAQVFLPIRAGAPKAEDDEAQRKLRDLRQQAAKGRDFAELARANSGDATSVPKGGDLGWLREDQLIAPVRDAAAGLPENGLSDLIRTPDGWRVLKLLGTKPAAPPALAEMRDAIARALRQQRAAQNERAMVDALTTRRPIQLDEIRLQHAADR